MKALSTASSFLVTLQKPTIEELLDEDTCCDTPSDITLKLMSSTVLELLIIDIKKRLITAPEVISVLPEVPILGDLLNNLYDFATLEQMYLPSRLLSPHTRYYVREMPIFAYSQLLESYRSLTLESLTVTFCLHVI
ncbi:hypothetical protein DFJ58DRAFT_846060 [Suillus subalutaceus]|uniref:uncharacterized protein n=1 Tax=Suillus subalutaceus TaxID=48586 RepID=UPI001B8684A7|nr:uncharacterized protein DFJ58DRAFT_846060 [Suillus subalutaceus]KAG1838451.1 hypothetical protein DFJ58DRAFT_846060 [Suillus subalutaceus]